MTQDISRKPMGERFEFLFSVISSQRFLTKQGLANEVPFFICPYKPDEAVEMEQTISQLIKRLEQSGVRVLEINLYDQCIEIMKQREVWDKALEAEPSVSKAEFKEDLLDGVLDPEQHLVPAMADLMGASEFDVLCITGVGEVFPYIRSHTVLNNLQSKATQKPTVLFFPGTYTHSLESGASLDLFGRLHDDKYYRAFNIYHCEP